MLSRISILASLALLLTACPGGSDKNTAVPKITNTPADAALATGTKNITIVGTADVHGHVEMLPLFAGYVDILRSDKYRTLVLVDGGDMFQGTLASNLREGAPIVEVYNLLKYDAVTIGNHEFDFGPVGQDSTATKDGQDPRGALKARAASANFPFLSSNILASNGEPVSWPNVQATTLIDAGGVKIGIIGISTIDTPKVTLAENVFDLSMAPLVESISEYAQNLRKEGAQVIIVAAHAGGDCKEFDDPKDLHSCDKSQEIFEVANGLPKGTVNVIVAGHTHRAVAHEVNGIAIVESYSRSQAFGRVDLEVSAEGVVSIAKIHPPKALCAQSVPDNSGPGCDAGLYEGSKVTPNKEVAAIASSAAKVAEALRSKELGISITGVVQRSRGEASPLGNLFADLILQAQPKADVSLVNGGSLRAELPAGPLLYGSLFEALPFDNRFALVTMRGSELRKIFVKNLGRENGLLSIAGIRVQAKCKSGALSVTMTRNSRTGKKSKTIRDNDSVVVATSDFLASGGDGLIGEGGAKADKTSLEGGLGIRDAIAELLAARAGILNPDDKALFNPKSPRVSYPGQRPVDCSAQ